MAPGFNNVLPWLGLAGSFKTVLFLFLLIYPHFTGYLSTIQQASDLWQNEVVPDRTQFDYIIVGAGAAGCMLANRLSKSPRNKVLLLERGGDPNPFTAIPALTGENISLNKFAYVRKTTPQPNYCGSAAHRECSVFTGHGLGGSSNINALINTRGSPQIFDRWAEITRDRSWRYENVLQVFKEVEDYHGYYEHGGNFGEWYVDTYDRNRTNPGLDYFMKAAASAGFPLIDFNNGHQARFGGVAHMDVNVKNGQRWSLYKAFLAPSLARPNLTVVRYALVTKVHFGNHGNKVSGVEYSKNGKQYFVKARKDVIVSAGAIGSPQLLLLSGIGPKDELDKLRIPVRLELPVGKGLVDHPFVPVRFSVNKTLFFSAQRDTTVADVAEYVTAGTGNLGRVFSTLGVIFAKSSIALNSKSFPDMELNLAAPVQTNGDTEQNRDYFVIYSAAVSPRSAGSLKLNTSNPLDDPLIDPAYLSHPDDIQVVVEGLQLIWNMVRNSEDFKGIDTKMEPVPACTDRPFGSTAFWRCVAAATGGPSDHFIGTCRMGAVVDSKLKVVGTPNLRVIDASVMPLIPNCHPTAATVMVANMGAGFIEQSV